MKFLCRRKLSGIAVVRQFNGATCVSLEARDLQDRTRNVAPLKQAPDAIYVDTSQLTIREAIDLVLKLAHERGAPE